MFYNDSDGSIIYKFPLTRFLSTTDAIVLVVYAYGGYVNLHTSSIKLRVQQTYCMGLFIYCPVVTGNGILVVEKTNCYFFDRTEREGLMREKCSGQHMLTVLLRPPLLLPNGRIDSTRYFHIYYCQEKSRLSGHTNTSFIVDGFKKGQAERGYICLATQTNPFDGLSSTRAHRCNYVDHIQSTHTYSNIRFHQILSLQNSLVVPCSIEETFGNNANAQMNEIALRQNEGKPLFLSHISQCIHLEMEIVVECRGFVALAGKSDPDALEDSIRVSRCSPQVVTFTKENNAFAIKWSVDGFLQLLYEFLQIGQPLKLTRTASFAIYLGEQFSRINFQQTSDCPKECQEIDIFLIYKDYTGNNFVTMTWNVNFRRSNIFTLHMYTVPFLNILVWLGAKTPKEVCFVPKCDILVDKNIVRVTNTHQYTATTVSDKKRLSASYTYVWTLRNLTWTSANAICSDLGMQLLSIASEDELELITTFLIGDGLLTPCRLETPLCAIFIGLQVQVSILVH